MGSGFGLFIILVKWPSFRDSWSKVPYDLDVHVVDWLGCSTMKTESAEECWEFGWAGGWGRNRRASELSLDWVILGLVIIWRARV